MTSTIPTSSPIFRPRNWRRIAFDDCCAWRNRRNHRRRKCRSTRPKFRPRNRPRDEDLSTDRLATTIAVAVAAAAILSEAKGETTGEEAVDRTKEETTGRRDLSAEKGTIEERSSEADSTTGARTIASATAVSVLFLFLQSTCLVYSEEAFYLYMRRVFYIFSFYHLHLCQQTFRSFPSRY